MSEYGCESWRIYNTVLSQMIQQSQKHLQEFKYDFSKVDAILQNTLLYFSLQETNPRCQLG
jgi:hypothetical protein